MQRILLAVFSGIVLAVTLVVGATAADPWHASPRLAGRGSIHHQTARATTRVQTASTTKEKEKDSEDGQSTLHFGPIASTSPDSGTCGNNWANDQFNRVFTVVTNTAGTVRVVEFFKDGTFTTVPGSSPGACENGPNNGGMVKAGIAGRFQGYFLIKVTGGSLNRSATCTPATCGTTAGFIHTLFGATATYDVTTFLFNYNSKNKQLISHHWKNASLDRGGNLGDIRTS